MTGIQTTIAGTDGYFEIRNGSDGGFGCCGIRYTGQSGFIYSVLHGQLDVAINTVGLISLTNITGTMSAKEGMIKITGGQLSEQANGYTSGFLQYTLSGLLNEFGTANCAAQQKCSNTNINEWPKSFELKRIYSPGWQQPKRSYGFRNRLSRWAVYCQS